MLSANPLGNLTLKGKEQIAAAPIDGAGMLLATTDHTRLEEAIASILRHCTRSDIPHVKEQILQATPDGVPRIPDAIAEPVLARTVRQCSKQTHTARHSAHQNGTILMQLSRDYATSLPETLHTPLTPRPFRNPTLIALNTPLAQHLGLDPDWLQTPEGLAFLTHGQRPDAAPPVAMAYAGHQFGHFVPSLGDGRAMLVGELPDTAGTLHDLHLKGSGPTPFSRRGDGLAALGPVLREYLVSEAMTALNIPSTRALAVLTTGETVQRETALPGGVIARIARSHIRVGTFQYLAARNDLPGLTRLLDYTVQRLYPHLATAPDKALAFLEAVTQKQATLVARWMLTGFIHGVMNTDNMAISGETIDFGPCAFLDTYAPDTTFSYIDQNGRYAYNRQPDMALWNLGRLAETLLPLINPDPDTAVKQATDILNTFDTTFANAYVTGWRNKLGLSTEHKSDTTLISRLLTLMQQDRADFTQTFRSLNRASTETPDPTPFLSCFQNQPAATEWLQHWKTRTEQDNTSPTDRFATMQATNPRIIPRNHQIEHAITAAISGDFTPFHTLHTALATPFTDTHDGYDTPPQPHERVRNTFCGT